MEFQSIWKGRITYLESLKLQEELKILCRKGACGFVLGFECFPTITLGLRGGEGDLLLDKKSYAEKNISIVRVKRGGQATLHSPGQLVIYPVVDMKRAKMRVKDFILFVEDVTRKLCGSLSIAVKKEEGGPAGLFTKKGKLAFFGIHVSEGISQHGLALNVKNDLRLFSMIKSCGEAGRPHDKLSHYAPGFNLKKVFDLWFQEFLKLREERFSFDQRRRRTPFFQKISQTQVS